MNISYLLLYFSGEIIFEILYGLKSQIYKIRVFESRVFETLRIKLKIEVREYYVDKFLYLTNLMAINPLYN